MLCGRSREGQQQEEEEEKEKQWECSSGHGSQCGDGQCSNVVERMRSTAHRAGVAHPYLDLNYEATGRVAYVFAGYGKINAERLRSIQVAVDPNGVFSASGLWRGFVKVI